MAAGVNVPSSHEQAGIAPPLDWFPGDTKDLLQFTVLSGQNQPTDRLTVRHRNAWFWISDTDMRSKSAFLSLLTHFNIQVNSIPDPRSQPVLTLPIGR